MTSTTLTVDKQLTEKDKLTARWFFSDNNASQPFGTGANNVNSLPFAKGLPGLKPLLKLGWTRVLSGNVVMMPVSASAGSFSLRPHRVDSTLGHWATRGNSGAVPRRPIIDYQPWSSFGHRDGGGELRRVCHAWPQCPRVESTRWGLSEKEPAEAETGIFTTLPERTRVQPSFRKRFEPGSPFANGRLLTLFRASPEGLRSIVVREKTPRGQLILFR